MSMSVTMHRFTADDIDRMAEAGVLSPEDHVELIDGRVVAMSPIGPRHAQILSVLVHAFAPVMDRAIFRPQNPLRLSRHDQPEPDFALVRPPHGRYGERHPVAADTLLIVEISQSSLGYDREIKLPLYARAGVQEVWIVDLNHDRIEVHRDPGAEGYGDSDEVGPNESVSPQAFPDLILDVGVLLKGE